MELNRKRILLMARVPIVSYPQCYTIDFSTVPALHIRAEKCHDSDKNRHGPMAMDIQVHRHPYE